MAALPTVGADNGTWGTELNAYLQVGHDSGGRHGNGHVYNALEWGALGDGATDDATAIQAMIDASPASAVILFPPTPNGYAISTMIRAKSGRFYWGYLNQSLIKQANGANLSALVASEEWVTNVNQAGAPGMFCDLGFDGNSANNTSGHGLVIQQWQTTVARCWFKHIPQSAVVVTDRCSDGTTLVTNSIVENKLTDLKIDTTGQYGIWVTDYNGQCTDGRILSCDINTTASHGMFVERAAGWYLGWNHVYSVKGSGYVLHNCFATWVIGNQVADFANDAAASGTFSGISATLINGYGTVIADNQVFTRELSTSVTYQHIAITCDGDVAATDGTYGIVHHNRIRGGWGSGAVDSIGIVASASANQQTSAQPASLELTGNIYDRIHTESSIGSYIKANFFTAHTFGPAQIDGNLTLNAHLIDAGSAGTLAAGASAGTSPPAPVSTTNKDVRGACTFGTGTSPAAGSQVVVTFNAAFASAPVVVLCAGNAATAALQLYVTQVTTTGFKVACGVAPAASQANTVYSVSWMIVQ